ncbi:unnamed protein product [Aphanomyces euteiches]
MTSDEALQLEALPKSILIIGGGVIGLEWASLLNDFGVEVTIIEYESRLVPLEDEEISKELERIFKKRKIKVITGAKVLADSVKIIDDAVQLQAELKGEAVEFQAEKVLVSVGRLANIENIGLESTDIKLERGVIRVNAMMQTSESHIYAVGDVIGGLQLAHAAGHEGITAAEHIAGLQPHPNAAHLTPRCIYSRPEIASVGWTEKQARERGHEVKIGKFNFKAIGKALVYGDTDGFVKVIADQKTNDILGVHMIGPHVTDFISEAALAHVLEATPWEVGQTIHPHPTLSEALGEAMLAVDGKAIGIFDALKGCFSFSILEEVERVILTENNPNRDVYGAIADPTRRKLLRLLADVEELPLYELTVQFEMGRTAVSKHLTILKESDLVKDRKVGRETRYRLNAGPLKEVQDWVAFYGSFWKEKLLLLDDLLLED